MTEFDPVEKAQILLDLLEDYHIWFRAKEQFLSSEIIAESWNVINDQKQKGWNV